MNWLLIVVLAVLAVCAFRGMQAGLIKTVFSVCSTIVVLLLTLWISPQVSKWMQGNENVFGYFSEQVDRVVDFSGVGETISEQMEFINQLPLPGKLKEAIQENNNADTYAQLAVNNFEAYVVNYLTCIIINAIAFVVTFLVLRIVVTIVSLALNLVSKLPIIHGMNKLAGLAAGLIHGIILVWIAFVLITMFGGSEFGSSTLRLIGDSRLLGFLYDNNLILRFITDVGKIAL